jgi:hypothetical protein
VPRHPREASSRQRYAVRVGMHISTLPSAEIDGSAGASRGRNNILTLLSLNATPVTPPRRSRGKLARPVAETGHVRDHARASVRAGCGETSSPGGLLTWAAALGFRPCRCLILHLLPLSASVGFRLLVLYAREVFRRWCHQDDGRHAAALFCLSQLLKA